MKKGYGKKLVAPVVITVLLLMILAGYAAVFLWIPGLSMAIKLALGGFLLLPAGVCLYVLIERIKEIRSGEEDDLSQY